MDGEITQTEQAPAPTEAPVQQTESVQVEQQPAETEAAKPAGFDPVEFSPEQKARFDRVYGNMKRYENTAKEMEQANLILAEQVRQLHEGQGKIVTHLQAEDFKSAEQQLKSDRQAAWTSGNTAAYDDANDKLRQLDIRRALTEMAPQKPQQAQPQQNNYMRPVSGEAVLQRAIQQGAISTDEATTYRSWMDEADGSGNPRRPWVNETDPRNPAAAAIGKAVFNSPAMQNKNFGEKLREIDRLMGIQTQAPSGQNVLPGGNLTPPRKNNNINSIKLPDKIEKLAIRSKFGGPNAKSDQDHVDAWKRAALKSQQNGASR